MSQDGISSVADLTIVIDANTEKFANGVKATQEMIDKLATEGGESLGKFDGMFAKIGDFVGAMPGKYAAAMAAVNPVLAQATAAYETLKGVAEKVGLSEDVAEVEAAFSGLWANIQYVGAQAMAAAGYEVSDLVAKLDETRKKAEEAGEAAAKSSTVIGSAMARAVKEVDAGLTESLRGIDGLSNAQAKTQIDATKRAIDAAREGNQAILSTMGAFTGAIEEGAATAIGAVDALENRLKSLEDQFEKTKLYGPPTPDFADLTKYIEGLERATREQQLRNEVLGKSRAAAEAHLAVRRAEMDAEKDGKIITDESREALVAAAAARRAAIQTEENFTEAKKRAADAEREAARMSRGRDGIANAMKTEIEQLELKIAAQERGIEATARETFIQKQLAAARRANVEMTPEDLAGIEAMADAYEALIRRQKSVQEQLDFIRSANQAMTGAITREFDSWTRGGEFSVKRMTASILQEFAKIAFQAAAIKPLLGGGGSGGLLQALIGGLTGGIGGGGGGDYLSGYVNTLHYGGPRAEGGPVEPGKWYMVGERGPEPFVPNTAGTIIPNHAMTGAGKGGEVVVTIHASSEFDARIDSRTEGVVARVAPSIVGASVEATGRALPGMLRTAQTRQM